MTKSKGLGRGGKRSGSGRRAINTSVEAEGREPVKASLRVLKEIPSMPFAGVSSEARKHAAAAIKALVSVAANGSDASRVKAAETLLRWAFVSPQVAKLTESPPPPKEEKLGKKEAALRDAMRPNTETSLGALMAQRTGSTVN